MPQLLHLNDSLPLLPLSLECLNGRHACENSLHKLENPKAPCHLSKLVLRCIRNPMRGISGSPGGAHHGGATHSSDTAEVLRFVWGLHTNLGTTASTILHTAFRTVYLQIFNPHPYPFYISPFTSLSPPPPSKANPLLTRCCRPSP